MTALPASSVSPSLSPLRLGAVTLSVADLTRSLRYYREAIGLSVLEQHSGRAVLGAGTEALLELHEQVGATPSRAGTTGLYHLALLLPGRADLGRFVRHLMHAQVPVQGASDHLVSEAIYLQDPDGHGTEVYADRPQEGWEWQNGQIRMGTLAANIPDIVASAGDTVWTGLPAGTVMGHVHLKVSDLETTRVFYAGLLGLDVVVDMARQGALFVSRGGYHHHFGLNVWSSRGGGPAPESEARLLSARVHLPAAALEAVYARLRGAGHLLHGNAQEFTVHDPSGNLLNFASHPC